MENKTVFRVNDESKPIPIASVQFSHIQALLLLSSLVIAEGPNRTMENSAHYQDQMFFNDALPSQERELSTLSPTGIKNNSDAMVCFETIQLSKWV